MRVLVVLFMFVSSLCLAQEPSAQQEPSPQIEKLKQLDKEIATLQAESQTMSGSTKNVVHLQLLNKNNELRDVIQDLIDRMPEGADEIILEHVRQQVKFISDASKFLLKKIDADEKVLDKKTNEEKLLAQKALDETRRFATHLFEKQWVNYQWLNKLGKPTPKKEKALIDDIARRLEFISASLTFNNQQEDVLNKQLKSATEGEKTTIQLIHILAKRKVASDIYNLQFLVKLADSMDLDTATYKRQLFETTGTVTNELLNTEVIFSLISSWGDKIGQWVLDTAPQLLFQLLIVVAIIFVFRWLKKFTRKMVNKAVSSPNLNLSQLMQDFFTSMSGNIVFAIGLLIALSQLGADLTPILTGFGIAGIVIGFALQDTLSNFASGMMLLIYRPFDVGDFVEAGGVSGKVSHMSLVNTTIKTFDNQIIIVPNSKIWGDIIKNVTHERVRRVDMVFGIGYSDDIAHAEKVLADIVDSHPSVLSQPETTIKVHTLNTSSVDFIVRPWVRTEDYWEVYWDITREVKIRFDKEGISIPFPQQDVHLYKVEEARKKHK